MNTIRDVVAEKYHESIDSRCSSGVIGCPMHYRFIGEGYNLCEDFKCEPELCNVCWSQEYNGYKDIKRLRDIVREKEPEELGEWYPGEVLGCPSSYYYIGEVYNLCEDVCNEQEKCEKCWSQKYEGRVK